jgi:two-component system response regulator HydG
MQAFRWPGNVRQLINALEYGVITCRGEEIDLPALPAYLDADPNRPRTARRRGDPGLEAIRAALERAAGNRSAAAKALGISRVTLWKRIRESDLA